MLNKSALRTHAPTKKSHFDYMTTKSLYPRKTTNCAEAGQQNY